MFSRGPSIRKELCGWRTPSRAVYYCYVKVVIVASTCFVVDVFCRLLEAIEVWEVLCWGRFERGGCFVEWIWIGVSASSLAKSATHDNDGIEQRTYFEVPRYRPPRQIPSSVYTLTASLQAATRSDNPAGRLSTTVLAASHFAYLFGICNAGPTDARATTCSVEAGWRRAFGERTKSRKVTAERLPSPSRLCS